MRLALPLIAMIALAACKPDAAGALPDWLDSQTVWQIHEIGGAPVPDGIEVTLTSPEPGLIAGSSGCNRYNGRIESEGGRIRIGALAGTRMACLPPAMEIEQRFHSEIGRAETVAIVDGELRLSRDGLVTLRGHRRGA